MATPYLNIYMNNPTVDLTDGTAISTDWSYLAPLVVSLDAATNETKKVKLAIRTEAGYETSADTVITAYGTSNALSEHVKLCLTENGEFTNSITIPAPIGNANVIFWAQVSSSSTETPQNDRDNYFSIQSKIRAL